MRTRTAFLVPLSLLVASNAIVTSCAPSDSDSYRSRSAQSSVVSRSIEEQLAVIDAGGNIAADDPRVARFLTVLSSLAAKYPETRQQISDMSVKAHQMLQQAGTSELVINVMEGIDRASERNPGRQRYSEHVAAYLALRNERRQSHQQAVQNLREFLRAIDNY